MKRTGRKPQSLSGRIRWLFTRDGIPVLASIIVGIVLGFFVNGVLGLLVATLAGFAVLKLFDRLPFRIQPWQALVMDLSPVIAKLFFSMAFLLPFADYLALPSGHTPNTLPKYLSIVVALPTNLFSRPTSDIFPGFVFIVIVSIVLMYWGSMNLEKSRNTLLAFVGLLLYTLSPTITSVINGDPRLRIVMPFFSIGYYFAWIGLLLIGTSKILPRFLKVNPALSRTATGMLNLLPPVIAFGLLSHLNTTVTSGHFQLFQLFDFESEHHFFAELFSSGFAGLGAGVIVGQAYKEAEPIDEYDERPDNQGEESPDNQGENEDSSQSGIGPPPEEPPDIPGEPPVPQGPVPSTDPLDPTGTTIQQFPDGTVTKTLPDGTKGTLYGDGTIYAELTDGSKITYYPDGTNKAWFPDGSTQIDHPNNITQITKPDGRTATIYPDGKSVTTMPDKEVITLYPDESMTDAKPDGSSETWDKNGRLIGRTYGPDSEHPGWSVTRNPDDTLDGTSPGGDKFHLNKDGSSQMTTAEGDRLHINEDGKIDGGLLTDKNGSKVTFNQDTTMDVVTPEGDKITLTNDLKPIGGSLTTEQGLKYTFNKDGSGQITDPNGGKMDFDIDGNPISGSITDNKGNKMRVNSDGSYEAETAEGDKLRADENGASIKLADGTFFNSDVNGKMTAAHFKDDQGTTIDVNTDDKGASHYSDSKGNTVDVNKDGSGKSTDEFGNSGSQDADGNVGLNQADGKKWTANTDGSGTIEDKHGNKLIMGKDKSFTLKEPNGKTTSYTAGQANKLAAGLTPGDNLADSFHNAEIATGVR